MVAKKTLHMIINVKVMNEMQLKCKKMLSRCTHPVRQYCSRTFSPPNPHVFILLT